MPSREPIVREKFRRYIKEYEQALGSVPFNLESRCKALGILQRMAMVAVNADDEGPDYNGSSSIALAAQKKG